MKPLELKPNLFQYATKELSQDAFIAWLFSWLSAAPEAKESKLRHAAYSLLQSMLVKDFKPSAELQCPAGVFVTEIETQSYAADLWFVFEGLNDHPTCLLIEDKTHTSFHSGQLKRASEKGLEAAAEISGELTKIYFKTGWINPEEKYPPGEFRLFLRKNALDALQPYKGHHVVLDDFIDWLETLETNERTSQAGAFNPETVTQAFANHAGLEALLTATFPRDTCGKSKDWYAFGMGRGGVPWMHYGFHEVERTPQGSEEDECYYWRCDLRGGWPAISLRKYWKHSKSEEHKAFARARFAQLNAVIETTLEQHPDLASRLTLGERSARSSSYFEQELLVYYLGSGDDENPPELVKNELPALHNLIAAALRKLPDTPQ